MEGRPMMLMRMFACYGTDPLFVCASPCLPGLIGSLFSLLQFLASPVTGALSDHYGRRPLLLLTTVSKICHLKLHIRSCAIDIT